MELERILLILTVAMTGCWKVHPNTDVEDDTGSEVQPEETAIPSDDPGGTGSVPVIDTGTAVAERPTDAVRVTDPMDDELPTDTGEAADWQTDSADIDRTECSEDHGPSNSGDWIADFENGTLQATNGYDTFVGFHAYHDGTEGTEMEPSETGGTPGPANTDIPACSPSVMCVRNTRGQFTNWGAGVAMFFEEDADGKTHPTDGEPRKIPWDLDGYKGVAFYWMKLGGISAVKVSFPDIDTHPHGGVCDDTDPATQCYNDWSYQLTMVQENTWVRQEILFEDLEISLAWGLQPEVFTQSQVFGMRFQLAEAADFDFCIDDIYLIPEEQ